MKVESIAECSLFGTFCNTFDLPCGHLLGKGWPLGSLVCYVLLCFVTFPCGVLGPMCTCIDS